MTPSSPQARERGREPLERPGAARDRRVPRRSSGFKKGVRCARQLAHERAIGPEPKGRTQGDRVVAGPDGLDILRLHGSRVRRERGAAQDDGNQRDREPPVHEAPPLQCINARAIILQRSAEGGAAGSNARGTDRRGCALIMCGHKSGSRGASCRFGLACGRARSRAA